MFTCQTPPRALARAISLALGITSLPVLAIDYTWVGGSGDWDATSNWDPDGLPQAWGDTATIQSNDVSDWTVTYNAAMPGYFDALTLNASHTGNLRFDLSGSSLDVGEFVLGSTGHALAVHTGTSVLAGTVVVGRHAGSDGSYQLSGGYLGGGDLRIGEEAGSQGTFTWTGGDLDVANLHVGQSGAGTFVYDTGGWWWLAPHQNLVIGGAAGGEGVFEQRSGVIHADTSIVVGAAGRGVYRQLDGQLSQQYGTETVIGHLAGSDGTYELSGATSERNAYRTVVGDAGTGRFVQTDGVHYSDELIIGRAAGGVGDYQLSGGSLGAYSIVLGDQAGSHGMFTQAGWPATVALDFGQLIVGRNGSGRFILDNGGQLSVQPHQTVILGEQAGSVGVFEQRDSLVSAYDSPYDGQDGGRIIIGERGRGIYRQHLGRHDATETVIGHLAGSEGTYELSGSVTDWSGVTYQAEYWADRTIVGDAGTGHFIHTAGAHSSMELIIGRSAGGVGDYQLSGGSLGTENLVLGQADGSQGTFDFNGGELWAWNLILGDEAGSQGVFNFNFPGGQFDVANLVVGRNGRGIFIYEGVDTVYSNPDMRIVIGEQAGSEGVFEQRSGHLHAYWGGQPLIVGEAGRGVYRQLNDTYHNLDEMIVGHLAGSEGAYELSGYGIDSEFGTPYGPSYSARRTVIGDAGTGHVLHRTGEFYSDDLIIGHAAGGVGDYQFSGEALFAGNLVLGDQAGSQGTLHWSDGQLDMINLRVGRGGAGTFIQDVGPGNGLYLQQPDQSLVIGELAGSDGVFEQRSGDVIAHGLRVTVGDAGRGTYRQLDGLHDSNEVVIAHLSGSEGRYELAGDGAGLHTMLRTVVGDDGVGRFVHNAGTHDTQELVLGRGTSTHAATGRYDMSGMFSSLYTGRTVVGARATGRFIQSDGWHYTQDLIIGQSEGSNGTYALRGGSLESQTTRIGATSDASGAMKVIGETAQWWNHGNVYVGAEMFTLADTGAALLELQDGAMMRADAVIVGETGTVRGDGRIDADVTNNGRLAPGLSAGQLDIIGNYTQLAGGTLSIEIGGHNPGIDQDFLYIFGAADLAGTLDVSLLDGYLFSLGDSFDILYAGTVFGAFDDLLFPIFNGMTFDIVYDLNTVRLTVVSAVPVPAAAWLFGSGVVALMGIARRRKAA